MQTRDAELTRWKNSGWKPIIKQSTPQRRFSFSRKGSSSSSSSLLSLYSFGMIFLLVFESIWAVLAPFADELASDYPWESHFRYLYPRSSSKEERITPTVMAEWTTFDDNAFDEAREKGGGIRYETRKVARETRHARAIFRSLWGSFDVEASSRGIFRGVAYGADRSMVEIMKLPAAVDWGPARWNIRARRAGEVFKLVSLRICPAGRNSSYANGSARALAMIFFSLLSFLPFFFFLLPNLIRSGSEF